MTLFSFQSINPNLKQSKTAYLTLLKKLGVPDTKASFHCLESGTLSEKTTETLFSEVSELHYQQWTGRLMLGADMHTNIQLCPPPGPSPSPRLQCGDQRTVSQHCHQRIHVHARCGQSSSLLQTPGAATHRLSLR